MDEQRVAYAQDTRSTYWDIQGSAYHILGEMLKIYDPVVLIEAICELVATQPPVVERTVEEWQRITRPNWATNEMGQVNADTPILRG